MRITSFLALALTAGLLAVTACGDDGSETTTTSPSSSSAGGAGTGGGGPGGGSASSTGGTGGGPACPAPEPAHAGMSMVAMQGITANLIDQDGNPAANVNTTICGTNICSDVVASGATGDVSITAPATPMDDPRFNTGHVGEGYAKLTAPIPAPTHDFGTVRVIRLPPFAQGGAFAAGADVSNSNVTLSLVPDAEIEFELDHPPAQQRFVAAVVDITGFAPSELPAVPQALGLEVLVATGPFGAHICPGAALTFPNAGGWTAGAEVEIYINGNLTFGHYAPYGEWALVSEGVVSQDGNTVSTKPGMEIELLGVFGVKAK